MRPWSKLKVATLATSNSFNNLTNLQYQQQQPTTGSLKPLDIGPGTDSNQKFYESVFDLSPEYNGLPFVKRLKILNERQKLAELESALQQRSFSLDYQSPRLGVDLYRCHSEAAGVFNTANLSSFALSPESNETQERKRLKSILKNLQGSGSSGSTGESKGLSKAPTLEGYVARHSKFMKSVTFNSTLSSPPRSANAIETEPQISSTEPQISHSQSKPKHFLFLPSEVNTYNAQLLGHKSSSAPAVTSEVPTKLDFKGKSYLCTWFKILGFFCTTFRLMEWNTCTSNVLPIVTLHTVTTMKFFCSRLFYAILFYFFFVYKNIYFICSFCSLFLMFLFF